MDAELYSFEIGHKDIWKENVFLYTDIYGHDVFEGILQMILTSFMSYR